MARRPARDTEPAFGSDSFLDVIANVVGVIIILIVIVGLRVRHLPADWRDLAAESAVTTAAEQARADWERERARIEAENQQRRVAHHDALAAREQELARREKSAAERAALAREHDRQLRERRTAIADRHALAAGWQREADQLRQRIALLRADAARDEAEQQAAALDAARLADAVVAKRREADGLAKTAAKARAEVERGTPTMDRLKAELAAIAEEVARLERAPAKPKEWRHYPAAIAKNTALEELHFRCKGGRVAAAPLDQLIAALKTRLAATDGAVGSSTQGTIGPVAGFSMKYVLMRDGGYSLTEQLKNPLTVSIRLREWELIADDTLGENAAKALRPGSAFLRAIEAVKPDTHAITLWVYPESFAIANALREHLHFRDHVVALRPLPLGVNIAGSPFGSASMVE